MSAETIRIILDDRVVDLATREVSSSGAPSSLSAVEARLLAHLAAHEGRVVPRDELLAKVWGLGPSETSRVLETTIRRLRNKIEPVPGQPRHIVSVYGEGYRFLSSSIHRPPSSPEFDLGANALGRPAFPPPPARLLGRAEIVAEMSDAMQSGSVIQALVGPAGVGKSSVALALAEALAGQVEDRRFWDLAHARTPEDLIARLAGELSEPLGRTPGRSEVDIESLRDALCRRGRILLVLDGADALTSTAWGALQMLLGRGNPRVGDANGAAPLANAPRLLAIVTSRGPVLLPDADVRVLPPLDRRTATELLLHAVSEEATRRALSPERVDAIVGRLDGLPLAIELAAARLTVLTPEHLARRLDARFDVLRNPFAESVSPRHASLRAAIDVSWELLSEPDRLVLAQCGVFPGAFELEAAEVVLATPAEAPLVLDALHRLVSHSLVQRDEAAATGSTRLRLLDTMRDYARERLRERPELERQVRARFDAWLAGHAASRVIGAREATDRDELHWVGLHYEPLAQRARGAETDDEVAAWCGMVLAIWHKTHGPASAAFSFCEAAVRRAEASQSASVLADALVTRAVAAFAVDAQAMDPADVERALDLAERASDERLLARVELYAAVVLGLSTPRAFALLESARRRYAALGIPGGIARVDDALAWRFDLLEDPQEALRCVRSALAHYRLVGPSRAHATSLMNHAMLLTTLDATGRASEAHAALVEGRNMANALRLPELAAHAASALGTFELSQGRLESAERHLGEAAAIERRRGGRDHERLVAYYHGLCSLAQRRWDDARDRFDVALSFGSERRAREITAAFRTLAEAAMRPTSLQTALARGRQLIGCVETRLAGAIMTMLERIASAEPFGLAELCGGRRPGWELGLAFEVGEWLAARRDRVTDPQD